MKINKSIERKKEMYLDYVNNFITLKAFAEHYDINIDQASHIIDIGRKINDLLCEITLLHCECSYCETIEVSQPLAWKVLPALYGYSFTKENGIVNNHEKQTLSKNNKQTWTI